MLSTTDVAHFCHGGKFDWTELPWIASGFEAGLLAVGRCFLRAFLCPVFAHTDLSGDERGMFGLDTEQGVRYGTGPLLLHSHHHRLIPSPLLPRSLPPFPFPPQFLKESMCLPEMPLTPAL